MQCCDNTQTALGAKNVLPAHDSTTDDGDETYVGTGIDWNG